MLMGQGCSMIDLINFSFSSISFHFSRFYSRRHRRRCSSSSRRRRRRFQRHRLRRKTGKGQTRRNIRREADQETSGKSFRLRAEFRRGRFHPTDGELPLHQVLGHRVKVAEFQSVLFFRRAGAEDDADGDGDGETARSDPHYSGDQLHLLVPERAGGKSTGGTKTKTGTSTTNHTCNNNEHFNNNSSHNNDSFNDSNDNAEI